MRMLRIAICDLFGSITFFHIISKKKTGRFSGKKKVIEHKMFVFNFSTILPEKFLIIIRTEQDIITNVHRS